MLSEVLEGSTYAHPMEFLSSGLRERPLKAIFNGAYNGVDVEVVATSFYEQEMQRLYAPKAGNDEHTEGGCL